MKYQQITLAFVNALFALFISSGLKAQSDEEILRFNKNGKFKIVQFTDIHLKEYHKETSDSVMKIITDVLAAEKPNLVILTGDVATSENVEAAWLTVAQPMIDAKVPWTSIFGNHDSEHGWSNKEIAGYLAGLPFYVSKPEPENVSGFGNFVLEIKGNNRKKTAALIYCIDSNAYTQERENKELGKYDWIKFNQIHWYREISEEYTRRNGNRPYPALAFFHIPLPEYKIVQQMESTLGDKEENVASPLVNSGMYCAILEMRDVMGIFAGHDHNNNYIGCLNGICLAYGCKTGIESYGKLTKGARIIEIKEDERAFSTWIRTTDTPEKYKISYPEYFTNMNSN